MLLTAADMLDHLLDFGAIENTADSPATSKQLRFCRRATLEGLRNLANQHRWNYYTNVARVVTNPEYGDGTVAFVESTQQLTLTDGTWPSWAGLGTVILIGNTPYEVQSRVSDTVLKLKASSNPGQDLDAGTGYILYQDSYALPADLISMDRIFNFTANWMLAYVSPEEFLGSQRWLKSPGQMFEFTIMGDQNGGGGLVLKLCRPPSIAVALDFLYTRRPRSVGLWKVSSPGTAAVSQNSPTVTGTTTAFTAAMVGSVFRLGPDGTNLPTGDDGDYPANLTVEAVIASVESATSLTLATNSTIAATGRTYVISDPIDIMQGSMQNLAKRFAERHYALLTSSPGLGMNEQQLLTELRTAMGADSLYQGTDVAGSQRGGPPWAWGGNLRDMGVNT